MPQSFSGARMKMQLNKSSLFPDALFLRESDRGKSSRAWRRAEDGLMDFNSASLH